MSFIIEEPNRGERPRAAWAQQVTRAVNNLSRFATPGLLFREGSTGSGVEPLPRNLRDRTSAAVPRVAPGAGCFELLEATESTDYGTLTDFTFANQYYKVGEVANLAALTDKASELAGLDVSDPASPSLATPFVALKISATGSGAVSFAAYADFAALGAASRNLAFVTVPLWLFSVESTPIEVPEGSDPKYAVTLLADCDFRNMPRSQLVEVLPS